MSTQAQFWPRIVGEIAFESTWNAHPAVWTDVSPYLWEFHVRRGRRQEATESEAAEMTASFDNRTRRFEPLYSGSPYYPNVKPRKRIRIRAVLDELAGPATWPSTTTWPSTSTWPSAGGTVVAGETFNAFHGFVDDPGYDYEGRGAIATFSCVDLFEALARDRLTGIFAASYAGERINALLDLHAWPAEMRTIDPGRSIVQGVIIEREAILPHIQQAADADLGVFFVDAAGWAVFHDRHRRLLPPYTDPSAVFSSNPAAGEYLYVDVDPVYGSEDLYTVVTVEPPDLTEQVASDQAAIDEFGYRVLPRRPILASEGDALGQAGWLLRQYKSPTWRLRSLTIDPTRQAGLFYQVLSREIGDRIRVRFEPWPGGGYIVQDAYIESIAHDVVSRPGQRSWRTTWSLSSAEASNFWILGHSTYGILGSTTILAY